jgi:hypothetical protein
MPQIELKEPVVMALERILIMGNSITWHEPKEDIGWSGDWGMAASSRENDYVHLLMKGIRAANPDAHFMIRNIAEFEIGYWDYCLDKLNDGRCFNASAIVLQIGENVDDGTVGAKNFGYYYQSLTDYLNPQKAKIICANCFWDKPNVRRIVESASAANGYALADIGRLGEDRRNMAIGQFANEDVARHPSDTGMMAIADCIQDCLGI